MAIQLWQYRAEYEAERDDILAAVDQVLRSGRLILGDSVQAFEREFAQYCSAGHGVGVGSGTDALTLALRALDIRSGDEVIRRRIRRSRRCPPSCRRAARRGSSISTPTPI